MKKLTTNKKEVTDLIALRIIAKNEDECYKVHDVIHDLYERDTDKYKDYIANPKSNGYQSLHTVIIVPTCNSQHKIEVQIRTLEMHRHAELGEAAHWKYKLDKEGQLQCNYNYNSELLQAYEALKQPHWTEAELINYKNAIAEYYNKLELAVQKL